ncbi:cytochrome b562 [Vibrio vulnificus]|uniref:cytochrome b562 n=1 Tax=Vibrio vulnificus TaxID=672 RepID=UPI00165D4E48|nr:cytochrome b562 [Vibrio vulnificus]
MKLSKVLLGSALVMVSFTGLANQESKVDLKANMKEMKLEFRQAAEAQDTESMQAAVNQLRSLVANSKTGEYAPEKNDLYHEGFNKLTVALDKVNGELEQGNLEAAKQALVEVDELRKEYHEKKKTSIWGKLFG